MSIDELTEDVRSCFLAGAEGVHLHVRDGDGAETLDPAIVNETCRRIREVAGGLGRRVAIGLTAGAWIVPNLADRMAMIREWEGWTATVNLSEDGFVTMASRFARPCCVT